MARSFLLAAFAAVLLAPSSGFAQVRERVEKVRYLEDVQREESKSPFNFLMEEEGTAVATRRASSGNSRTRYVEDMSAGGEEEGSSGDNGTNPAQNSRMAIVTNEWYELDGGNKINTTYFRLKFPIFENKGALMIEAPYKWYDINFPVAGEVGGIGDLKFQLNYNVFQSCNKKLTGLAMMEFFIPSADSILLNQLPDSDQFTALDIGSGKYILGPGVGAVYAFAPNFIVAPLYFYEASVAGNDARTDISRGKLRLFAMYAFESGFYTLPEFQLVSNFNNGNQDAYFAPEFGFSKKGTTFYVKPGFGIAPDTNDRTWGVEIGTRVIF